MLKEEEEAATLVIALPFKASTQVGRDRQFSTWETCEAHMSYM